MKFADPGLEVLLPLVPLRQPLLQRPHQLLPLASRPLQRLNLLLQVVFQSCREISWQQNYRVTIPLVQESKPPSLDFITKVPFLPGQASTGQAKVELLL